MIAYEPWRLVGSSELPSSKLQTMPGLMSNWFTCSKPGDGVWWWCWWWWWWCNKGALIWWGVKIIVLCWWSPPMSMPEGASELLLLLLCWEFVLLLLLLPGELWCKSLVFCSSESLHDSDDPFFTLPGLDPLCVFTCFAKWSDRMNLLLQTGQANLLNGGFQKLLLKYFIAGEACKVPTFFRRCAFWDVAGVRRSAWIVCRKITSCRRMDLGFRITFRLKLEWIFYVINSRSPVCQRRCALRWLVFP